MPSSPDNGVDRPKDMKYQINLPFGPPPVLPDVEKQLRDYILCPERLPIHDFRQSQLFWARKTNAISLYRADLCPPSTTLKVERDPTTGQLLKFVEVPIDGSLTAKNSLSLQRAPAAPEEAVRGSASNFPFWPGGFPEPELSQVVQDGECNAQELLVIPPGFERGLDFSSTSNEGPISASKTMDNDLLPAIETILPPSSVIDLASILRKESEHVGKWVEPETNVVKCKDTDTNLLEQLQNLQLDKSADDKVPFLHIAGPAPLVYKSTEWAELIDVAMPVSNFEEKVPDMAHKYPFELDPFQKQAIMHLEQHEHVFVAAHTSAGKTVVAEYAIALSRKHMTRAIYTSPIKALSNQKYRDFQLLFGDVGLITGDFQLNQTASCLVMTTEILRSMLYCGSDVVRDLEYVIFDEVHYVNDSERGHVWEEVLILLPPHVVIVMLSATVPNTLQFADWVGRTKCKKVYVMSTPKRPVPLEHYLYLGMEQNKTGTSHMHLVLDSNSNFRGAALLDAQDVRSKKKKETPAERGRGGARQTQRQAHQKSNYLNPLQEETIWTSLLHDLQKREKLPTVAFTLSRNRCDSNAEALSSVDLLSGAEKSHVHRFFQRCLQRLKEPDQKLPQVIRMERLLKNGIGVHHSGILPILKEIVEMLFQEGYVKFLFATETFAMGVNMPARTVVFDSIEKFDGISMRPLNPAEYIQMAGRAGRRGLDPTGTVFILVKREIPEEYKLRNMMLGQPIKLSSQFRLTYSMILSLLRVETITVEGMMEQSFRELNHKLKASTLRKQLDEVKKNLVEMPNAPTGHLVPQLKAFHSAADLWINHWDAISLNVLKQQGPAKEIVPGRVLLINKRQHLNKLALVLKVEQKQSELVVRALVLGEELHEINDKSNKWFRMLALSNQSTIFVPEGNAHLHTVLNLSPCDLWEVAGVSIKVDTDKVLGDWEKRQIPRFRDDPPWAACNQAVQELLRLSLVARAGELVERRPLFIGTRGEIIVSDINVRDDVEKTLEHRTKLESLLSVTDIANFEKEFSLVFAHEELVQQEKTLMHQLSVQSLSMYPEYERKVEVLRQLGYINRANTVQLKGRVACEMGNHELLITEMVLCGQLTLLQPPEIAALLSGLVFQQKSRNDDKDEHPLTPGLKKGIEEIKELMIRLRQVQQQCNVIQEDSDCYEDKINFDLAGVIYEWATGKPFAQIMELTDVQEGIIVRCIQQLGETLRDVKDAAKIIGDPLLQAKMDEASVAIKRDIVFAASLYTQ